MNPALNSSLSVLLIIIIAYSFKRLKMVNIDTARSMSSVVMYLTLPCAILSSAHGMQFDTSLFDIMLLSIAAGFVLLLVGFFSSRDPRRRVFNMLNISCFNIGNFVIPFMQSSMTPKAFLALCMFDFINALFCFGGSYAVAMYMNRRYFPDEHISLKSVFREMSKSLPSYTYILAVILAAMHLQLPDFIMGPVRTIAGANTLLCFMIIGIVLQLKITGEQLRMISKAWLTRYALCGLMAVLIWLFLPHDPEVRFIIMIIVMAPVTSLAPIMTMKGVPEFTGESGNLNTVYILTSISIIAVLNSLSPLFLS